MSKSCPRVRRKVDEPAYARSVFRMHALKDEIDGGGDARIVVENPEAFV